MISPPSWATPWLVASLTVLSPAAAAAAPPAPRKPARAAPRPAAPARKPASAPPTVARVPVRLTAVGLGPLLRGLGYLPEADGQYQRLKVDEPGYGYKIDLSLSQSGEWLVCMAHLAEIPDLTKVPSNALLSLLTANDSLLGMSFSYDRANGRIMLNASVPNRSLDPTSVRSVIEGMKATVRNTQPVWDTSGW
jgi:hypothetical protein